MAANVVSGARDQIRDQFTSGPLGATLSLLRDRITPERRVEQPLARSDTCRASGDALATLSCVDAREP